MSTEQRLGNDVQIKCRELIEILEEEVEFKPELQTVIEILQSLSKKYKLENYEMNLIEGMEPEDIEKMKEEHGDDWVEHMMSLRDDMDELDNLEIE